MQELVIISGKGGTGKTSLTAAFAVLAQDAVLADCDVDAADLHLVLAPQIEQSDVFRSGHEARIRPEDCTACEICARLCRFEAVVRTARADGTPVFRVDPAACEGCGLCVRYCPQFAIDFEERECGRWYVSQTRCGPMAHASLSPAGENSGKLVSLVREKARGLARQHHRDLVLIDGAPGIGCPVIASITGTSLALVVTEPTVSGLHDLERITQVTAHFHVPTSVCVNKHDLNPGMTTRIETFAREHGLSVAGRVRYDRAVTQAQIQGMSLVEHTRGGAVDDVRELWRALEAQLRAAPGRRAGTVTRSAEAAAQGRESP